MDEPQRIKIRYAFGRRDAFADAVEAWQGNPDQLKNYETTYGSVADTWPEIVSDIPREVAEALFRKAKAYPDYRFKEKA